MGAAESVVAKEISQDIVTARDLCGNGGLIFAKHKPRIAWPKNKFPILYHIDNASAPITDKSVVDYAIRRAFDTYNIAMDRKMFERTMDEAIADVLVRWQYLDGILGNLGRCYYNFYSTGEIKSASVNFDASDRWYVADTERCGYSGQYFDVESLACHQVGHVVGLAHNDIDPFATMWPYSKAGDTLRRTLGQADLAALRDLYPPT